jgi:hypothetical protein
MYSVIMSHSTISFILYHLFSRVTRTLTIIFNKTPLKLPFYWLFRNEWDIKMWVFNSFMGNRRHMFLGLDTRSMLRMPPRYNGTADGTLRISLAHSHLRFRLFAAIYIRLLFRPLYLLFALRDNTYIHSTLWYLLSAHSLLCFAIHIRNSSDRSMILIPILSIRLPLFYPHNGLYVIHRSIRISTICTGLSLAHATLSFRTLYGGVLCICRTVRSLCFIIMPFSLYIFLFLFIPSLPNPL